MKFLEAGRGWERLRKYSLWRARLGEAFDNCCYRVWWINNRFIGVLLFFILIGFVVLVGATVPVWVGSGVDYMTNEDIIYYHNLSANVTGFSGDISFAIDTDQTINLTNSSGSFEVAASVVVGWLRIFDSSMGNLTINATSDNQTGYFVVPIQATNTTDDDASVTNFEFQVNATNDAPNFTDIASDLIYNFTQDVLGAYTINALDEEEHYPLFFDLTFWDNCTHAGWAGRVEGENCSVFNLTTGSNTSTILNFSSVRNEVGVYWANLTVNDSGASCPHAYCDNASYEVNKSSAVYVLKFNVFASLDINVTNCTGATVMEDEQFNCTINITTQGSEDDLSISSYAFFRSNFAMAYDGNNRDWFYANATNTTTNFVYSLPISITPTKGEVGNWTINFSVVDSDNGDSDMEQINIYVNFTEFVVELDAISDVDLYENSSFNVNAVDTDLLIWDSSVKDENLTFASNVSWVSVTSPAHSDYTINYSTSVVSLDYDSILASGGMGNYSVRINVTDGVGNSGEEIFVVQVLNETAPVWNATLDDPVVLNLMEGVAFSYNVSVNVSDEGDTIIFYYENVSGSFCSLNSSTFNSSSGMISFTPTDCDVGYHNVTIIASDSKLNSSHQFNFSVDNVADAPDISFFTGNNYTGQSDLDEGFSFIIQEDDVINFSLEIDDDDFLIPSAQRAVYYNESLSVDVVVTNSTGSDVDLFEFSFKEVSGVWDYRMIYNATFTPNVSQVDNYTIFVNVSDVAGNFTNRTFYLNVSESFDAPVLAAIGNLSFVVGDYVNFSVSATDNEDDYNELNLSFSIVRLNSSAPNLTIGNETGRVEFNMGSNESYAGIWGYNISVADSDAMTDVEIFYVYVYGEPSLVSPSSGSVYNLTENSVGVLNFTISHLVENNLTYEFWIDSVNCSYQNSSNCDYGSLVLRDVASSFGNGSVFGWSFISNFTDESYGNYKNLTVSVYPNSTALNSTQRLSVAGNFSFRLNVSHANAPIIFNTFIGESQANYDQEMSYDLSNYFSDADFDDSYYVQGVNLSVVGNSSSSNVDANGVRIPANISCNDWSLVFSTGYRVGAFSEWLNITAFDINSTDNSVLTSDVSNDFQISFTVPTVTVTPVPTPTSGGSSVRLKYFSIRIVVPKDVIISDENYIDVPFSLQNTGTIDLTGIDLTNQILYNGQFSDDVRIELDSTFIPTLRVGETRDYSMRILVDTHKSGKYKATVFANVTSPKLSDWGDFFIELKKIDEASAENILIFTEKLISENPECLELTELFREAEAAFLSGDFEAALNLARDVGEACEEAISSNEQIRYPIVGFVKDNFYYISFSTLMIFVLGFVIYVYKRARFNKYRVNEL